jgi:hypothetical protein
MKSKEVYCMNCGLIDKYSIIPSIRESDGKDFMYTICHKCYNTQPECLGKGCMEMIEVYCPKSENDVCTEIFELRIDNLIS